jgi:hypothetical protein
MRYFVTYYLYTENVRERGFYTVQEFTYYPTLKDLNEVGDILCAEHGMFDFLVSRGREVKGRWVYNEGD